MQELGVVLLECVEVESAMSLLCGETICIVVQFYLHASTTPRPDSRNRLFGTVKFNIVC